MKLWDILDIDYNKKDKDYLEIKLQDEKIWSDREKLLSLSKKKSLLEKDIYEFNNIIDQFQQLQEFMDLYKDDPSDELEE